MKNRQVKNIAFIALALLAGLGIGYLLFGNEKSASEPVGETLAEAESSQPSTWTCSMHPQVRRDESGDCPICGMELIPQSEAQGSDDPLVLEMTENAMRLANVQTSRVQSTTTANANVLSLSGKVQADERRAATQVAHLSGRLEKLFVSFRGEPVRKGQKLAVLYAPELVTAQQELHEALRWKDARPELLEAARQKLRNWKISEASIKEMESSQEIQENITVYADADGVVMNRRVAVGDYVKQGEPLFDLMDLSVVWVLFDAYEDDLARIRKGSRITFRTQAAPEKTYTARVTFIDPVIDPKTRTAALRATVSNPEGRLKPEMFVSGTLTTEVQKGERVLVPKSAVLWTGKRSVVYVRQPEREVPSFAFREVELGESRGDFYVIQSGLAAGEDVVTHGNFAIDAAAQLNNQNSMINRLVESDGSEPPSYRAETPQRFRQQLAALAERYLRLKDALVQTDSSQSRKAAAKMLESLDQVDMTLVEGEAHRYWMDKQSALQTHTEKISEAEAVSAQRDQFDFVSQALITTLQAFGVSEKTLYVQHCPMAKNNTGADWLSSEKQIRNPYFGDQMLTCGSVQDTIR